jgi:hypothetical protein
MKSHASIEIWSLLCQFVTYCDQHHKPEEYPLLAFHSIVIK